MIETHARTEYFMNEKTQISSGGRGSKKSQIHTQKFNFFACNIFISLYHAQLIPHTANGNFEMKFSLLQIFELLNIAHF